MKATNWIGASRARGSGYKDLASITSFASREDYPEEGNELTITLSKYVGDNDHLHNKKDMVIRLSLEEAQKFQKRLNREIKLLEKYGDDEIIREV